MKFKTINKPYLIQRGSFRDQYMIFRVVKNLLKSKEFYGIQNE